MLLQFVDKCFVVHNGVDLRTELGEQIAFELSGSSIFKTLFIVSRKLRQVTRVLLNGIYRPERIVLYFV